MRIIFSMIFSTVILCSIAQDIENSQAGQEQGAQAFHGRVVAQVDSDELPESVKRMISSGEYRKWDIEEAYQIHGGAGRANGQASYIVVVKRRDDRFALYYDQEGKLIRQELMGLQETSNR
ncbi:MAG: hypothetical protein H0X62_03120 [Bacteroidetes bacterium]|nr:hypothetical protein [Bacteroidota bacterium]